MVMSIAASLSVKEEDHQQMISFFLIILSVIDMLSLSLPKSECLKQSLPFTLERGKGVRLL